MFSATFLGHHSWVFSGGRTHVLVDPLLFDRFGHTPAVGFHVHPPRAIHFGEFPPIDAVFLTHEHEGHLDFPSLHAIHRRTPIFMPRRSSPAMERILREMGFDVRLVSAGEPIEVGDLVLLTLPSDQVHDAAIEEWDNLAYVVYDRGGHGSLFSNVDMPPCERMWRPVQDVVPRPGLWALTNNFHDTYFQFNYCVPNHGGLSRFVESVCAHHRTLASAWAAPEALLLVGVGLSFGPNTAINGNAFTWNSDQAAQALSVLLPKKTILAPFSGQTFEMRAGKLVDVRDRSPFAVAPPREQWPSRAFRGDMPRLEDYTPATGRTEFPRAKLAELRRELDAFAGHLYARSAFRQIHSLSVSDCRGHKPTFALELLANDRSGSPRAARRPQNQKKTLVFEYNPGHCSFEPVDSRDPKSEYLAVFECWATDLLASLRSEISNRSLVFGRCRTWNNNPRVFTFDLATALFEYVNPLRMPERFLRFYRSRVRNLEDGETKIRPGRVDHATKAPRSRKRAARNGSANGRTRRRAT